MKNLIYILLFFVFCGTLFAQDDQKNTDANIIGHVVSGGEHIKFANIIVVGTTIGGTTDETGHYRLINMPVGEVTIRAQALGFKPKEETVLLELNKTVEIKFDLEKDVLGLAQVVVTSDRNEVNRLEASTIVNTLTPKMFESTQSTTFSETLEYTPGVRTENNCGNCGFTQVRMNGLEGPYSQILINSRPVFSGLAGVYGLELIPTNMIEKVEVVRGGGSALYGSNAIAGTINLILKDPIKNSYEIGSSSSMLGIGVDGSGDAAMDNVVNFNTSLVSSDNATGLSLYGFYRDRDGFDANGDDFTEITTLYNTTIGGRLFHRFSTKNKLTIDFFNINEERRGGDMLDHVFHQANIAEALDHQITNVSTNYEQFFREKDLFSVYASGQIVDRDSYYGAEQSLSDYGKTEDFSYTVGAQYNADFNTSKLLFGLENVGAWLEDTKLGYFDVLKSALY
jgi:outer membrane receptor for ferrienterochelin and colicins